ncbi:unnamed protein product [Orchesella dallaii]|uniref:Protein sel-1 1 n=1 Tax=Orchesella dallaii TaxID=48710 RepID=A0ABP1Q685_9HEXA
MDWHRFLFLLLALTLCTAVLCIELNEKKGKSKESDKSDGNNEDTIQIVISNTNQPDEEGSTEEDDGLKEQNEGNKLKFVLDKQFIFNTFQQSPVDPIGATSSFRGTVGKRNTEVPGEWAYHVAGEEDSQHKQEAMNRYNEGLVTLFPIPQKSEETVPKPTPSLLSTSVYIRTSVGKSSQVAKAYDQFKQASPHHHVSRELIGFANLLGQHGVEFNIPKAYELFSNLSSLGYPNSQFAMGLFGAYGLVGKMDPAVALLHYTFGAVSGSAFSSMALGYRYWGGIGVQASCERALEQYRTVASIVASEVSEAGVGPAIQRVRLLDELEGDRGTSTSSGSNVLNSDILDYYTMLAERGDVQAQVGLGQLHFQGGRGISPDHHLALRYFQRAADAGSPVAMAFLGKMFLEGNDAVEPDYNQALRWFQRAAEQGSPVGQSGMGLMHLNGKGLPRDPSKALQYFTMAAEQGWVDGQLHLGNMYVSGIGVRRDYNLAAKYYNLAAQSGHILAIYNLAQMHATGTGMMRSCTAAVELYKSVAERGRWGLLLTEAYTHYQEKRFSNSLILYLLLSELGYEAAQSNAAFMFERGEIGDQIYGLLNSSNITPNAMLSKALQQWSRSASQGYSPARVRLGDYYYYGWGTSRDYTHAATQYRVASESNRNAQAMFNLAYMHENGLGLKQDLHLAKRFYDMAAETSNDAKVPVALALVKLQVVSYFKGVGLLSGVEEGGATTIITPEGDASFFDFVPKKPNTEQVNHNDHELDEYWDLYLITLLIGILGLLLYGRHQANGRNIRNNAGG